MKILNFILLITAFQFSFAQEYPGKLDYYVNDFANVIDDVKEKELDTTLKQFYTETTNQVVVVVLPELKGNLEETSTLLFRKWGVGQASKNNGVAFFIFVKDENGKGKARIEVGPGLEGVLPDSKTKLLYERDIRPHLVKRDFTSGVTAFVSGVVPFIRTDGVSVEDVVENNDTEIFVYIFTFILVVGTIIFLIRIYMLKKEDNFLNDTTHDDTTHDDTLKYKGNSYSNSSYNFKQTNATTTTTYNDSKNRKRPTVIKEIKPTAKMKPRPRPRPKPTKTAAVATKSKKTKDTNDRSGDYSSYAAGYIGGSFYSSSDSSSSSFDSGGGSSDGGGSSGDF